MGNWWPQKPLQDGQTHISHKVKVQRVTYWQTHTLTTNTTAGRTTLASWRDRSVQGQRGLLTEGQEDRSCIHQTWKSCSSTGETLSMAGEMYTPANICNHFCDLPVNTCDVSVIPAQVTPKSFQTNSQKVTRHRDLCAPC